MAEILRYSCHSKSLWSSWLLRFFNCQDNTKRTGLLNEHFPMKEPQNMSTGVSDLHKIGTTLNCGMLGQPVHAKKDLRISYACVEFVDELNIPCWTVSNQKILFNPCSQTCLVIADPPCLTTEFLPAPVRIGGTNYYHWKMRKQKKCE